MAAAGRPSRGFGYFLIILAAVASAVALVFGYYGAQLIYLAARFGNEASPGQGMPAILDIFSYITVVTAAALFPLIAVVAGAIAWLCWKMAQRLLETSAWP